MTVEINNSNIKEYLKGDKLVMIDFHADWCGPCKVMNPIIDELSESFDSRVIIGKLDVDEFSDIAKTYAIKSIPTIVFFKNGEVVDKTNGSVPKTQLEDMINKHI